MDRLIRDRDRKGKTGVSGELFNSGSMRSTGQEAEVTDSPPPA